jgi:hypothetical protein
LEETAAPHPVASWYVVAAIASLLFMALGCVGVIMHIMTDPATLQLDQRASVEAEPKWLLRVSTVGFLARGIVTLMPVLRQKAAELELLVSLRCWFGVAGCSRRRGLGIYPPPSRLLC